MRRIAKSAISIVMALMMALSMPLSQCFAQGVDDANVENAIMELSSEEDTSSLATPIHLSWKSDSTATATWDAVDGANYYIVNVYVSKEGIEIGTRETGTAAIEIDLQQEIHSIVGNSSYDSVRVSFDVQAKKINQDGSNLVSTFSEKSESQIYMLSSVKQLATPTNLKWNEDTLQGSWNADALSDMFYVQFKFNDGEKEYTTYATSVDSSFTGRHTENITSDLTAELLYMYNYNGFDPNPIYVSYRIYSCLFVSNTLNYSKSNYSDWSNEILYNPNNLSIVEQINLSPIDPVVALGDSIYLGKTINPGDAYYKTIQWSSADTSIATVDSMGKITGESVGTTTITAKIGKVESTATVSVYKIESSIDDANTKDEAINTAKDVIDSIVTDGDASGTDITNIENARAEIVEGAQNGNSFNVDINQDSKTENEFSDILDDIQNKTRDMKFACGYDVKVGISHEDAKGEQHHIGNITEFDNDIDFKISLPDNLPTVKQGYERHYSVVRYHDGEIDTVDYSLSGNTLTVSSDKFSDFVVVYSDTHEHDIKAISRKNPTCLETGFEAYWECSICHEKYADANGTSVIDKISVLAALGHDYSDDWTVDKAATCTEKGSQSHHCTRCDSKSDVTEISATGHTWDNGKVTTQPTCENSGVKTYECQTCHKTKTESIEALGHDYSYEWTADKAPTCTEKGSMSHHCTRCHSKIDVTEIAHKSHINKTTTTKATTSRNGSIVSKCSVCGKVNSEKTIYYPKTISLSKTSYVYNGKVQKPSITVKGSDGKTISSSNYTVTYSSGRKNVGKYTVKIVFKGNYSGSVSKTYTIVPKGTAIKSLTAGSKKATVKWTKQTTQTTGYQIQYSTSSKFTSAKTVTVGKNSTLSTTISKLTGKKKYYVRIRTYKTVSGTKYYSSWSSAKHVTTKK